MPPACRTRSATRVNARAIIHIVVDDLGYDNVGYHNSRFITPNIIETRSEVKECISTPSILVQDVRTRASVDPHRAVSIQHGHL